MSPTVDTLSVWRSLNARSTTSLPAPSTVRPAGRSCTTRSTAALALAGTCPRSRPCLATTPLVRYRIATRVLPGPHSTGPLEQFLHHLDATIGDPAARPSESASTYSPIAAVPPTNASTPTQPPSPACAHLCRGPQESISDSSSVPTSRLSDVGQVFELWRDLPVA